MELQEIAAEVYKYLVDPKREVQNVTEWAKREACWKGVKSLPIILRDDFVNELIPSSVLSHAAKDAKAMQKQDNNISVMEEVTNYGVENWNALLKWSIENKILIPQDISFLEAFIAGLKRGKLPSSEKQYQKIIKILEKARMESYPV